MFSSLACSRRMAIRYQPLIKIPLRPAIGATADRGLMSVGIHNIVKWQNLKAEEIGGSPFPRDILQASAIRLPLVGIFCFLKYHRYEAFIRPCAKYRISVLLYKLRLWCGAVLFLCPLWSGHDRFVSFGFRFDLNSISLVPDVINDDARRA